MKNLILFITLFISSFSFAQKVTPEIQEEEVFITPEKMPEFKGGDAKMIKFIQKNVKYPKIEKDANITGTCYVSFVVEKDGSLSGIRVLRGVTNGSGCDKEAMRVVSMMPAWNPGEIKGKPVRVQYNLPIKYTLHNKK